MVLHFEQVPPLSALQSPQPPLPSTYCPKVPSDGSQVTQSGGLGQSKQFGVEGSVHCVDVLLINMATTVIQSIGDTLSFMSFFIFIVFRCLSGI
jgi:hypothetical protein